MPRRSNFGWFDLMLGILLTVLGLFTIANPSAAFSWLLAGYSIVAIITGIVDILFYCRMRKFAGVSHMFSLATGIISIAAGILILFHPIIGKTIFAFLFAAWFIAHCISRLFHIAIIRKITGKRYYIFALVLNILGLMFGVYILFNPALSAAALGWLAGWYLLLAGIASIVEAFSAIGGNDEL